MRTSIRLFVAFIVIASIKTFVGNGDRHLSAENLQNEPVPLGAAAKVPQRLNDAQQREFLLKAVASADRIPDDQARQQTQWDLVCLLVQAGLRDEAFQQAMKLGAANPQMCVYSLTTIATDAIARKDQNSVGKAWDAARQVNRDSGTNFNHYVIELGFKLNRPLDELLAIAAAAKPTDRQGAYRDIRNELAWHGRVDEAYSITASYLPNLAREFNDREIAYYCSNARHYGPVTHDHIGQAIGIIEKMPKGMHRDDTIRQLIEGLFYVTSDEAITPDRVALAEKWLGRIDDPMKQSSARAKVLKARRPNLTVDEMEHEFNRLASREEKEELLRRIFGKLLEEARFEEADAILPRRLQLIKDQPRPEVITTFGKSNDELAARLATWLHHRQIVSVLIQAGRRDEARARLEAMKDLPDSEPVFMVGDLTGIRLTLSMELEDFDAVEKIMAAKTDPDERAAGTVGMAAWMIQKGQVERGWKHAESVWEQSSEFFFQGKQPDAYFWSQAYEDLANQLWQVGRPDDALKFLTKLPESRNTMHAFEMFGQLLVTSGRLEEFDQWFLRLPHETARTRARIGALREIQDEVKKATHH